MTFDIDIDR